MQDTIRTINVNVGDTVRITLIRKVVNVAGGQIHATSRNGLRWFEYDPNDAATTVEVEKTTTEWRTVR